MARAKLTIDLGAIAENWRRLNRLTSPEVAVAAVVKADAYGLGIERVAQALGRAGVRTYFVALAEEGASVRGILGSQAEIFVLSGYLAGDGPIVSEWNLIPVLNSARQFRRFQSEFPGRPHAVQVDSGMNRLGMEAAEFASIRDQLQASGPILIMSHLACADEPASPYNPAQLKEFTGMTQGLGARLSLAATGGMQLGQDYHFDLCRPGVGLYGGLPFADAAAVVSLELPVIQVREVDPGEIVGYGGSWRATELTRVATVSAGYADGILRAASQGLTLHADGVACKSVGRISMDLITVDVSHLNQVPDALELLGEAQSIDDLAQSASTIGYEVLTSLGNRYERTYQHG